MRVTSSEVHISVVYIHQATHDVAPDPLRPHNLVAGHHGYHLQERCLSPPITRMIAKVPPPQSDFHPSTHSHRESGSGIKLGTEGETLWERKEDVGDI